MKKILFFSIAMLITGVAHARMPVLAASCPDNLNVDTNEKGVVYINGKKAKVKKFNENYFEAKGAGATISISWEGGSAPIVSYTGKHGANGICNITATE